MRLIVEVHLSMCLIKHHVMKMYGGVEVYLHAFLNSALDRSEAVNCTSALSRRRISRYLLYRRLGGPQRRFLRCREESYPLPRRKSKPNYSNPFYTICYTDWGAPDFGASLKLATLCLGASSGFLPRWREGCNPEKLPTKLRVLRLRLSLLMLEYSGSKNPFLEIIFNFWC
jgi:hypothetical protein